MMCMRRLLVSVALVAAAAGRCRPRRSPLDPPAPRCRAPPPPTPLPRHRPGRDRAGVAADRPTTSSARPACGLPRRDSTVHATAQSASVSPGSTRFADNTVDLPTAAYCYFVQADDGLDHRRTRTRSPSIYDTTPPVDHGVTHDRRQRLRRPFTLDRRDRDRQPRRRVTLDGEPMCHALPVRTPAGAPFDAVAVRRRRRRTPPATSSAPCAGHGPRLRSDAAAGARRSRSRPTRRSRRRRSAGTPSRSTARRCTAITCARRARRDSRRRVSV